MKILFIVTCFKQDVSNLSNREQQLILQLMKSCEYHHLNEKQSIKCINKILNRNISRRTYYNYKSKLYSHDIFKRLEESIYSYPLDRLSLLILNDDADSEVRAKVNKLITDQFLDKEKQSFLLPSQYIHENNEIMKDKVKDVLTKNRHFKEMNKLLKERLNSLPKNTTIREEFIKCGKVNCNLCPHGPYYYGYWKKNTRDDNISKLTKKYLGTTDLIQ